MSAMRGMRFNNPLRPDLSKDGVIPRDKILEELRKLPVKAFWEEP